MSVKDLLVQKWRDKDEFLKALGQVRGKEVKRLPSRISQKELEEVAKIIASSEGKVIVVKDEAQIWGDDFLSALGFEEKVKKEPSPEPKEESSKSLNTQTFDAPKTVDKPITSASSKERKGYVSFGKWGFYTSDTSWSTKPTVKKKKKFPKKEDKKDQQKLTPKPKKESSRPTPSKPKQAPSTSQTLVKKSEIEIWDSITVKEFSEKSGIPLNEVMKTLLKNKIILAANADMDWETASLIWEELGVVVKKKASGLDVDAVLEGDLEKILAQDKEAERLEIRPPIVTVMGHVDHGKTKLLDYIRSTNLVDKEAGGITQSIWASQVELDGKKITFVDTPGHELFTSLRARWAKITDIAIIVVAADEWVKEQTKEAVAHAKEAGVPIIVAITKIDKPEANVEMVKSQLSEIELIPEEWGGDVPVVGVSAITGEGVQDLLETILLQAEIMELKYNPDRAGVGVILESQKDIKRGVLASLIVMTGKLEVGDVIVAYNTYGKIRRMINWKWEDVKIAKWWDPVMILGLSDVPEPGRIVEEVNTEKEAQKKIALIQEKENQKKQKDALSNFLTQLKESDTALLKLILKADSWWSLEAVKYALSKIKLPENVEIKIIHSDVSGISDSDIVLAEASWAFVIGFNSPFAPSLKKKADKLSVPIRNFNIIYELVEYIERVASGLVQKEEKEEVIGALEVLAVFYRKWSDMIVWGKVVEGKLINGAYFRLYRDWEEIGGGKITSLKREQENVNEVSQWYECWVRVKVNKKIQPGDKMEAYIYV